MSELIKKEIASAIKWTWIICIAALAYYFVTPKYYISTKDGCHRLNQVTGEYCACCEVDDSGKFIFTKPFQQPQKITKVSSKVDFFDLIEDNALNGDSYETPDPDIEIHTYL